MPQPHTPTPFWRAFESFPAQSSPTLEGRQRLGDDYTRFVSLLKATGETAGTVLILTSVFDNTTENRHNPDPNQWVTGGDRRVSRFSDNTCAP